MTEFDLLLSLVVEEIKRSAEQRRINAAYAGSWGDNGASELLQQLEIFQAGLERRWPKSWEGIVLAVKRTLDPEWVEFMRLKKKFEGK